jgi:hypothetical protein
MSTCYRQYDASPAYQSGNPPSQGLPPSLDANENDNFNTLVAFNELCDRRCSHEPCRGVHNLFTRHNLPPCVNMCLRAEISKKKACSAKKKALQYEAQANKWPPSASRTELKVGTKTVCNDYQEHSTHIFLSCVQRKYTVCKFTRAPPSPFSGFDF